MWPLITSSVASRFCFILSFLIAIEISALVSNVLCAWMGLAWTLTSAGTLSRMQLARGTAAPWRSLVRVRNPQPVPQLGDSGDGGEEGGWGAPATVHW